MRLGIQGCLLSSRDTVEEHRVAGEGDKFESYQERYGEYAGKKNSRNDLGETDGTHNGTCPDIFGGRWATTLIVDPIADTVSVLPRASGIPFTTSAALPLASLCFCLQWLVTAALFRGLPLSQWSHFTELEIPGHLCSHQGSLSQLMTGTAT